MCDCEYSVFVLFIFDVFWMSSMLAVAKQHSLCQSVQRMLDVCMWIFITVHAVQSVIQGDFCTLTKLGNFALILSIVTYDIFQNFVFLDFFQKKYRKHHNFEAAKRILQNGVDSIGRYIILRHRPLSIFHISSRFEVMVVLWYFVKIPQKK